jgi:CSLREA domain-containing protein
MKHTSRSLKRSRRYSFLICSTIATFAFFIGASEGAHAARFVVNSLADNATDGDTFCTLREAITAANQNADFNDCRGDGVHGEDTITFSVSGVITLNADLPEITDTEELTIDGQFSTISTRGSEAFRVRDGAALTLYRLNVRGPGVSSLFSCITNLAGRLTIINSTVSRCSSTDGGGIHNIADVNRRTGSNGTLTIIHSTLEDNSAISSGGGGILNGGTVTIIHSTLAANSAGDGGGGIFGGTVTIIDSLLAENSARFGGGIASDDVTIINSTLTDNFAWERGGGIYGGFVRIENSTLAANSAGDEGGGIFGRFVRIENSTLWRSSIGGVSGTSQGTIANSIVAGARQLERNCEFGLFTTDGGFNIDDGTSCSFSARLHSQPNTPPLLDPAGLRDNGGPTTTIALLPTSPAINAIPNGTNGCGTTIRTDQRGFVRPSPANGRCDTGAFERQPRNPN